jgi:hypothetical protein
VQSAYLVLVLAVAGRVWHELGGTEAKADKGHWTDSELDQNQLSDQSTFAHKGLATQKRMDADATEDLENIRRHLVEAEGTPGETSRYFDYALSLYKYRHLDKALHAMERFTGGGNPDRLAGLPPVVAVTYGELLGAVAMRKSKGASQRKMHKTSRSIIRQALERLRKLFKDAEPFEHHQLRHLLASLRPYHLEVTQAGEPIPPFKDDGIESSRRHQAASRQNSGFAGKRSLFETTACTMDRRDWTTLSLDDFHREYYDKGRPVILFGKGLVEVKGGDWSVPDLVSRFPDTMVAAREGSGTQNIYNPESFTGVKTSFAAYIQSAIGHNGTEDAGTGEAKYSFGEKVHEVLYDDIARPALFQDAERFARSPDTGLVNLFSIGPTNSYTYFHTHGDAFFALVHGEKHFIMYPFGAEVGYGYIHENSKYLHVDTHSISMMEWLTKTQPTLATRPVECTLKAGEVMYVPSSWRHAVINTKDAVGMTFQNDWVK